jgi:hypothetical protein
MKNKFWTLLTAFIDLIIASVGGFTLNWLLNSQYTVVEKWALGVMLVVGVFLLYAINALFLRRVYDSFRFIRKWFNPQEFIEGVWIQITDDEKLKKMPPTKHTIIDIKMKDGRIVVDGHSYNQENNGTQMTSFKIPYTTFNNETDTLKYHYDFITREYRGNHNYIGKSSLKFEKKIGERCFSKYNGKIISNLPRGRNEINVRAFKSPKKVKLTNGEQIKINETTIKRQDVRDYIESHISKIF